MKKKAFTLVEVIVAMAIIGIIAVGMLPVMSGGLMFLNRSKLITQSIFDVQKEMELSIESAKSQTSGLVAKTIDLFPGHNIEVAYYEVTYEKNGKKYTTMVSDTRPPEYAKLEIDGVMAVANNNIALKSVPSFSGNYIEARHDPITEPEYFKTVYTWYISKKGFNIPLPSGVISEIEVGTVYPAFPYDYEPLPLNFDTKRLNDLTAFNGKHVLFTASPASIYGKMGQTAISNPIYVSETVLPDKLLVQLDASLINESDLVQTRISSGTSYLKQWTNQKETSKNAVENTNVNQPIVKKNAPQTDFIGKYVDFDSNKRLTITGYDALRNKQLSLYMVVRGNANSIISHSSTTIHVQDGGSNPQEAALEQLGNGWKIARFNYTTGTGSPSGNVTIGNADIDISELLIYERLSTSEESQVIEHLVEKYSFFVPSSKITTLHDVTAEVYRDEAYSLPATVLATFEGGMTSYVAVNWTNHTNAPNGIVDTSEVKTLNFEGVAVSDSTKKVRLRLTVRPVTLLTEVAIGEVVQPMEIGESITMRYTYLPDNATVKTVKWTSTNPEIATIDSKTGMLIAKAKGTTIVSVEVNGLASVPYEVNVGVDLPPEAVYLREWHFESDLEGWDRYNINNFVASEGILSGTATTQTNAYILNDGLNLKVDKSSSIEIVLKNNSSATSLRIEFRNTNQSNYNGQRRKTFTISANDTDFKVYNFDLSDLSDWGNASNNLNALRIYPIYNARNQSFEIDSIKITE